MRGVKFTGGSLYMWRAVLVLCSSKLPKPQTHIYTERKRERKREAEVTQTGYSLYFWIVYYEDNS